MTSESFRVFLSYARKNAVVMESLWRDLEAHGYSVWVDRGNILAGDAWERIIEGAIEECALLLVLLTAESSGSDHVRREWLYAMHCGKRVIPLRFDMAKVPMRLIDRSYIGEFQYDYELGMRKLLEELHYCAVPRARVVQIEPSLASLFPPEPTLVTRDDKEEGEQ